MNGLRNEYQDRVNFVILDYAVQCRHDAAPVAGDDAADARFVSFAEIREGLVPLSGGMRDFLHRHVLGG